MDNRATERSPDEARAGSKEGVGRYVLVISTLLVIVLFVLAYAFVF
jgi:hypothetical protein